MSAEANKKIPKQDIERIAVEAIALSKEIEALQIALDSKKASLRAYAVQKGDGDTFVLPTKKGEIKILFPSSSTVLKKGANPLLIAEHMTHAEFETLFETRLVLVENFASALTLVRPELQEYVKSLVESRPNSPRVVFPK